MKVELGDGIFIEEIEPGFIEIEAVKQPAKTRLSRDEFARRFQAACNERLDPA